MEDFTEAELAYLKEHNRKRIKRIVAIVAITLTVLSIILVALSLSLGSRIDQLGTIYKYQLNIFIYFFKNINYQYIYSSIIQLSYF